VVQREVIEQGYFGVYCGQQEQAKITLTNINA
jgi:hypothetical protein